MAGFTVSDLDAVERAIASGELAVQYGDKRVEYRTVTQLRQAREMIRGELIAAGLISAPVPGTRRGGTTLAEFVRD